MPKLFPFTLIFALLNSSGGSLLPRSQVPHGSRERLQMIRRRIESSGQFARSDRDYVASELHANDEFSRIFAITVLALAEAKRIYPASQFFGALEAAAIRGTPNEASACCVICWTQRGLPTVEAKS